MIREKGHLLNCMAVRGLPRASLRALVARVGRLHIGNVIFSQRSPGTGSGGRPGRVPAALWQPQAAGGSTANEARALQLFTEVGWIAATARMIGL